jgi:hypothetical protein
MRPPDEEYQEIRDFDIFESLDLEPETVRKLFTSNRIVRVLAHLIGLDGQTPRRISISSDGEVKVYARDQVPDDLYAAQVTAADVWSGMTSFGWTSEVITFIVETYGGDIQMVLTDDSYSDTIYVPADTGISLDFRCTGYRYKNHTAGNNADIEVIATRVG